MLAATLAHEGDRAQRCKIGLTPLNIAQLARKQAALDLLRA